MKWEESKKWQRRVDTLRAKLSEKNKELEGAQKQLTSLKEMLARYSNPPSMAWLLMAFTPLLCVYVLV